MTAIAVVVALLALVLTGDLVVTALRPSLAASAAGRIGLALVAGPGVVAVLLFLVNAAGIPIAAWSCRILAALAIGGWLLAALSRRTPSESTVTADGARGSERWWWLLLLAPVVAGALVAVATPPVKDALVNWSLKVRVLLEDGTIHSPDLRATQRYLFHPNYPYLVPFAEAFVCGVAGSVTDQAAKLVSSCAQLGAALVVLAALRPLLGRMLALAFAALVASIPHFYRTDVLFRFAGSVQSGYADPMFAALAVATCCAALAWLATRSVRDAVLAAILLGLALFTKNEGMPFAAALSLGLGIAVVVERWRGAPWPGMHAIAPAAIVLLAIIGPWLVVRSGLPGRDENYLELLRSFAKSDKLWRLSLVPPYALEEALGADHHGFAWPLLAITLVTCAASAAGRARLFAPGSIVLLAVILVMAPIYAAVFAITPLPFVDNLVTSIPRTFFHLDAVALLLAARLAAPARAIEGGAT